MGGACQNERQHVEGWGAGLGTRPRYGPPDLLLIALDPYPKYESDTGACEQPQCL